VNSVPGLRPAKDEALHMSPRLKLPSKSELIDGEERCTKRHIDREEGVEEEE
jgi:hypothetical protein